MSIRIVTIDAFTAKPFAGNPAAVCVLADPPRRGVDEERGAGDESLGDGVSAVPEGDGFRLRWLTPSIEVDLCGHATLASAHVLWEDGHIGAGATAAVLHSQRAADLRTAGRRVD